MRKRTYWLFLILCLAVAFACFAYPMYVIRPFRHQGPRELSAALALIQARPWLSLAAVAGAILTLVFYWRAQPRVLRRIGALAVVVLVCGFSALARVNVYEIMFHPMTRVAAEPVASTKLDGREMVIAVNVSGASRAYPIRIISYHHIANDTVGGVPIVATY